MKTCFLVSYNREDTLPLAWLEQFETEEAAFEGAGRLSRERDGESLFVTKAVWEHVAQVKYEVRVIREKSTAVSKNPALFVPSVSPTIIGTSVPSSVPSDSIPWGAYCSCVECAVARKGYGKGCGK